MWYNRPIKFRGHALHDSCGQKVDKFVFGDLCQSDGRITILDWDDGDNYEVDPKTVAQLVGRDKDDNEVYEGDTMTDDDGKPFIVILKPQGCTFREKDGRRDYSSVYFEMTGRNAINNFTVKK